MMRFMTLGKLGIVGFVLVGLGRPAVAGDYYSGKNIRFIVGFAAGGGYDAYVSGEKVERYVDQIYSVSPDVKKRLEFLVRRHQTS